MPDAQSKTFWSFLILVDVLLMVSFGWALADRVYNLLEEPVAAPVSARLPIARRFEKPLLVPVLGAPAPAKAAVALSSAAAPTAAAAAPLNAAQETPASTRARKTVFSYRNAHARSVYFEASFTHWKPVAMQRKNGAWSYTVFLVPGLTYPYRFIVDGRKLADPAAPVRRWGRSYRRVD